MENLRRKLPPLTSLIAFEAAGRLGTFTAAAKELNVSREAVSRQIRTLEVHLGATLFQRDANTVQMSEVASRFFATVSPNLNAIAAAALELSGQAPAPDCAPAEQAETDPTETDLGKPLILIVDDEPDNIDHLSSLLSESYHVASATSGAAALSYLSSEAVVELILLDVRMPGSDGFDVCRKIRATASTAHIPIIFLTSLSDPADETAGFEVGANDFITRPIVPAVLRARLRSQIELQRTRSDLQDLLQRRGDRLTRAETALDRISSEIEALKSNEPSSA